MNKQINTLEEQKKVLLDKAKIAKKNGLTSQYNLALTAYKQTVFQQRRAQEMLLNFEITSQMKDMTMMTKDFLGGMGILCKEMNKLTDQKEFIEVQKQFELAMNNAETQAEQMDMFMEMSQDRFSTASGDTGKMDDSEIKDFVDEQINMEGVSDESIDAELEAIKKKLDAEI